MEWSKFFVSLTEKEQVKLKLKAVKRRKQSTCNSTNPKPLEARGKQDKADPLPISGAHGSLSLWFWTSKLQNCKTTQFCLCYFIVAAFRSDYSFHWIRKVKKVLSVTIIITATIS